MCFYDDGERPAVFVQAMPVAQRGHWCSECGHIIHPGERYERVEGLWEGYWARFKTCGSCLALRERVVAHEVAEGCAAHEAMPPLGELWECALDIGLVTDEEEEARRVA
jgi:hypothetical protein